MSNEERVGKHADVKCWMNWKSLGIFDETFCLACGIIILFVNGETSNGMEEEVAVVKGLYMNVSDTRVCSRRKIR